MSCGLVAIKVKKESPVKTKQENKKMVLKPDMDIRH